MSSYAIQIRTSCEACGSPLPLNALVPTLACPACSHRNTFSDEFWRALLQNDGDLAGSSTVFIGNRQVAFSAERAPPVCAGCGAELNERELRTAAGNGAWVCACGHRTPVRVAPPSAAAPGLLLLVGEDDGQLPSPGATQPVPNGPRPVYFGCPQCGGTLRVDGSARLVTCEYCNAASYLPDDLWHVFHPVHTARPWYAIFGGGSV
jgi:DNA-directed RNA polymerase subunit RPC12/RpoP